MYEGLILPLFPNATTVPFTGQSGSGTGKRPGAIGSTQVQGGSRVEESARQLAQAVPVEQRERTRQAYVQAFEVYRQLERKLGLPAGDAAGAVAAYIAGNYMALHGVEVPDPHFLQLARQMRVALDKSPDFRRLSPSGRRRLYEQSAMVGTFMAVTHLSLQKNPQPAVEQNFRNAARAHLQAALNTAPDRVLIDGSGLHLQEQSR
ncbi:DUF6683 family protein [Hydrogenophaga flava]|uniref:DUF6683 family protein n=1 Tax=Hydrogenophaga flava TaxID=65657 RepID=UPI0012F7D468|nr:DUF6683 family protein [Hydrogenophaga flava]